MANGKNTSWREIICDGAMTLIDDVRMGEELALSAARFLRKMSLYVKLALPLLSHPPELALRLQKGQVQPVFLDSEWTATAQSLSEETTVETGFAGADAFSCLLRTQGPQGVVLTPYPGAKYDRETGTVTFPVQETEGAEYELDFYTDGSFAGELSPAQRRLLALAIAIVWDERFSRNWLNLQAKIHDSSFAVVSEAAYMKAVSERLERNRAAFFDDLWKYEQDSAWNAVVPAAMRSGKLF